MVFAEFSVPDSQRKRGCEIFSCDKTTYSVMVSNSKKVGPSGPLTLVLKEARFPFCQNLISEFMVFNYTVSFGNFAPHCFCSIRPILTIRSSLLYKTEIKREPGKGAWIKEKLEVFYGNFLKREISIVSPNNDWEFAFVLTAQIFAYGLSRQDLIRGQWEHYYKRAWR